MPPPFEIEAVRRAMREHPEIDTMNEDTRGRVLDYAARALNRGNTKPWGRKARRNNPNEPILNGDGLTWIENHNTFWIVDAISGVDGTATWDVHGPFSPGENGWPWPPGETGDPVDPEQPPADTHKYMGGGNDTGTCDECGEPRNAPVHKIPESFKPHRYDPGENGEGPCDICQQVEQDVIHSDVVNPPPPPPPPPPPGQHTFESLDRRIVGLASQVGADNNQLTRLTERVDLLEEGQPVDVNLDPKQLEAAVLKVLQGLNVEVDIIPTGPKFNILGRPIDLNYDHGVDVRVTFKGIVIAKRSIAPRLAMKAQDIEPADG